MIFKAGSTLLLLLLFSVCYPQKKITINVAPSFSYRGGLLELENYPVRGHRYGYTSEFYRQFDKRSAGIDFSSKFLKNHLTINLSSYLRYGHLYYDNQLNKEVKSFKGDLFVDFLYSTRKRRVSSFSLFTGIGLGRVNIGTKFRYAYVPAFDSTGTPYLKESAGSFVFASFRVIAGFEKGRWVCSLSAIASPDEDKQPHASISLEPKIAYRIFSFKVPVQKK